MNYIEKEKLETYPDMALQVIAENFVEDNLDITSESCIMDLSLERKKEQACKPIYLTRI
jgi:hypothetical protein